MHIGVAVIRMAECPICHKRVKKAGLPAHVIKAHGQKKWDKLKAEMAGGSAEQPDIGNTPQAAGAAEGQPPEPKPPQGKEQEQSEASAPAPPLHEGQESGKRANVEKPDRFSEQVEERERREDIAEKVEEKEREAPPSASTGKEEKKAEGNGEPNIGLILLGCLAIVGGIILLAWMLSKKSQRKDTPSAQPEEQAAPAGSKVYGRDEIIR